MRVLHVIPSLAAVHGGPTRALETMERALSAQGVPVETATTDDDGPGRSNGKPCGVPLQENGVVRWYFRKAADTYKLSPAFARWVRRTVRNYDLLHLHALFSFTTTAAAWAARRAGVPYIVRPLGTLDSYGLTRRRPGLKRLSLACVERPILEHAAAVHFTSEEEASAADRLGLRVRAVVIPLGVESVPPAPRPAAAPGETRLLFLSRLDPKKNLEALLEAVAALRPQLPGLRLVVAGTGAPAYVEALRARAHDLGLGPQVHWAGHVEGAAKAALLAASDVFVLPSYSENFGIAAAEALAAGLPCVLGEGVAIAGEVARAHAGLSVQPDADSVAQALRTIIGQPGGPLAWRPHALALAADRYSALASGRRLSRLYTEILHS